ncbi:MAG: hypothetical protein JNM17_29220 [Archangium sp.]|nr:hypothetical protein [Archangium sp.]
MRSLLVVLALTVPLSARATDEDFQRFYNAALRLHESLEYEQALEQLALARKQAETGDQMSLVNLAQGVVLADLNKNDEAAAAFKAGLLLSPDAKLPLKVSPRVAGDVEVIRAKVKKELAPLIAKQEAERLKREQEAKELAKAKAEAEAKKAEAEARAREAMKLENDKMKAEADAKAKEAAKLLAEAEAKLKEIARLEEERRQQQLVSDKPSKVVILPEDPPVISVPLVPANPPSKAPMIFTIAFLVLGAASVGVASYFGVTSQGQVQSAKDAPFQNDASVLLRQADSSATAANVLFGTAGAMGLGALISGIVWGAQ